MADLLTPTSLTALLLAAFAVAALAVLHRLRSRPPEQTVPTLVFWRQILPPQRPATLWGHFARPWTFLLLAGICLLAALSLVAPLWQKSSDETVVAVIDSDDFASVDSPAFAARRERLLADLPGLGQRVAVIAAGDVPRVVAPIGTPPAVIRHDLNGLTPTGPAASSATALSTAYALLPNGNGRVVWYTARAKVPDAVAPEIAQQIVRRGDPAAATAARIVAAAFTPVSDGKGQLRVRLGGDGSAAAVTATSGAITRSFSRSTGTATDWALDDVPQDGRTWTVRTSSSDASGVALHVPAALSIKFYFAGEIPPPLKAALLAFGRETPTDAPDAIAVAADGVPLAEHTQTIKFVSNGTVMTTAASLRADDDWKAGALFDFSAATIGPGPALPHTMVGGKLTPLAWAGPHVVAGRTHSDRGDVLYLSATLWSEPGTLKRRPLFPRLVRALLDTDAAVPLTVDRTRAGHDPLWPQASAARTIVDEAPDAVPAPAEAMTHTSGGGWSLAEWALGAAGAALCVESVLLARRRIV